MSFLNLKYTLFYRNRLINWNKYISFIIIVKRYYKDSRMDSVSEKLVNPIIEKQVKLNKQKENNINNESEYLIKKSGKYAFIIILSYFVITFIILFSLFATNSKHTLLLFFLQSIFFITIPFFFHNTRVLLKESITYLIR